MIEGNVVSNDAALSGTQYFVGAAIRDISITGAQAVTGVGFQPKAIHFISTISSVVGTMSWGITDGLSDAIIHDKFVEVADAYTHNNNNVILMLTGSSIQANAVLTSFDSDGFTLTWSKGGLPTGNCQFKFICFK